MKAHEKKEDGKKERHKQTIKQPTNQANKHTKKQDITTKRRNAQTTIKQQNKHKETQTHKHTHKQRN